MRRPRRSYRSTIAEATAAGDVIRAFGEFIVGGNFVVGSAIFILLVIINFVVITKGAGRVAEVSARFTLDAMPGKQMAIDADLAAGTMTHEQAKARRKEIEREADFFGAMDGASKFVRGDAIAGLLMTAVNLLVGIVVGVVQNGMSAGDAASTYTILTVGDGLASQVPALLVSTAAGVVVTRAASSQPLGNTLVRQLGASREALFTTAGVLGGVGADLDNLMHMHTIADKLFGDAYEWSVLAAGRHQMPFATQAAMLGGNLRVGMEDSLYIGPGELTPSNAAQVTKIRSIIESLGLQVATPAEARERLQLKGSDNVNF